MEDFTSGSLPLVTILAVSYNQEKYVVETLNSIQAQTYPNIQLIIADDGSRDNTKQLIREWIAEHRPGTLFLDHSVNLGLTRNLNAASPYIQGEYYQHIGCEDNMLPNKIEEQVTYFLQHSGVDIIYSDMYMMDPEGRLYENSFYEKPPTPLFYHYSGDVYEHIIKRCFLATPTALMKTAVRKALKGYNEKLDIDDFDFWMRAARQGYQFFYHADKTMQYRVMPNSLSNIPGIFSYRNGFTMYYMNYDNRQPYRAVFNERLLFAVKNLYALKFTKTAWFALRGFYKTGKPAFLYFSLKSIPLALSR